MLIKDKVQGNYKSTVIFSLKLGEDVGLCSTSNSTTPPFEQSVSLQANLSSHLKDHVAIEITTLLRAALYEAQNYSLLLLFTAQSCSNLYILKIISMSSRCVTVRIPTPLESMDPSLNHTACHSARQNPNS